MNVIALDFETEDTATGEGCLEMYRPTASIKAVALAWRGADGQLLTRFQDTPAGIRADLVHLAEQQLPVVVYNVGFELLCFLTQFPDLKVNVHADAMRLVQVYANDDSVTSYGLENSAVRILGCAPWKQEIYTWLAANLKLSKTVAGKHLHQAPAEMFQRYNTGDVVNTLLLYEKITEHFTKISYDWSYDHELYLSSACMVVGAKIRGVGVDTSALVAYIAKTEQELDKNESEFITQYSAQVEATRALLQRKAQAAHQAKLKKATAPLGPLPDFGIDNPNHRAALFVNIMGIEPKHTTEGGAPSMKAEHMASYGEAGQMLAERKGRQIVLQQCKNLLALAEHDSRWHLDLKLSGTSTGRFAGGRQ